MSDELKSTPDTKLLDLLDLVENQGGLAWALTYREGAQYEFSILDPGKNSEYTGRGETRAGSVAMALKSYFESKEKISLSAGVSVSAGTTLSLSTGNVNKNDRYAWILNDCGPKKIEVIKVIREYAGLDLYHAKVKAETKDAHLGTSFDPASYRAFEKYAAALIAVGASVRITSVSVTAT